ncbi:MAG TPA: hypothetical protein VGM27_27315 [Acidobacteriaceae bacterium]
MQPPTGVTLWPQLQTSLEILANLVYLAKHEIPGSDQQMDYLTRAEEELTFLGQAVSKFIGELPGDRPH